MPHTTHPLLSGRLPCHSNDLAQPVGTAFIRARPVSSFEPAIPTLKATGKPAFNMQYVDYTMFYPCSPSPVSKATTKWFPPHQKAVVDGFKNYLKFGWLSWTLDLPGAVLGRMKFPAYPLAPLAPPSAGKDGYPLIIFSHGLCGSRHTYSQYCSALAAKGHIVLAIEHRDGSGPAVMMPTDQGEEALLYVALDDLQWDESTAGSLKEMGEIQIDLRVREIYEAYHHYCHLVKDGMTDRTIQIGDTADTPKDHIQSLLDSLKGKVRLDQLYLSGHSFGGGTILHTLQTPTLDHEGLGPLPVNGCILLDPWIELVGNPTPSVLEKSPPVLCINSPGFTAWTPHFERLWDMLSKSKGTLITLGGAGHMSFSDFALLKLGSTKTAVSLLRQIDSIVHAFIGDRLASMSALQDAWDGEGKEVAESKPAKTGQIIVHLLPDHAHADRTKAF